MSTWCHDDKPVGNVNCKTRLMLSHSEAETNITRLSGGWLVLNLTVLHPMEIWSIIVFIYSFGVYSYQGDLNHGELITLILSVGGQHRKFYSLSGVQNELQPPYCLSRAGRVDPGVFNESNFSGRLMNNPPVKHYTGGSQYCSELKGAITSQ